jgi:hypothetical protein
LISQLVVDDNNNDNNDNSSSIVIYEEKEEDDDDDDALSILAEWDSLLNSIVLHPGPFRSTPNRDNVIVTCDPNTFHRIKNDCGIAFFFFSRRPRLQELTLAAVGKKLAICRTVCQTRQATTADIPQPCLSTTIPTMWTTVSASPFV